MKALEFKLAAAKTQLTISDLEKLKQTEDCSEVEFNSIFGQALFYAIQYQQNENIDFLIEQNALLTEKNNHSQNCLHVACRYSTPEKVEQILKELQFKHPHEINWKDDKGNTPTHIACQYQNFRAVNVLIPNVDLLITNNQQLTPFMLFLTNKGHISFGEMDEALKTETALKQETVVQTLAKYRQDNPSHEDITPALNYSGECKIFTDVKAATNFAHQCKLSIVLSTPSYRHTKLPTLYGEGKKRVTAFVDRATLLNEMPCIELYDENTPERRYLEQLDRILTDKHYVNNWKKKFEQLMGNIANDKTVSEDFHILMNKLESEDAGVSNNNNLN